MIDRYSIPWCYGVCGCIGSPFLKQLKVLLGSDEALEEKGPRVDPRSTMWSCQVDPSLTKQSGATANLSSLSWSLFPFSRSLFLSWPLSFPHFLSPSVPQISQVRARDRFVLFFQWAGERCRYPYGLFIYFLIFFI